MKSYINVVTEVLHQALNQEKKFYLIKLENFTTPEIYLEVCKSLSDYFSNKDMEFIAKLSLEKYNELIKINVYKELIEELDSNGWIEKNEHLTKWRNYPFTNNEKNTAIILMGTEDVEDQGGLAEFYTTSPETIENYVGESYCKLSKDKNLYNEESQKKINNIFTNIFKYTEKDLLKVSSFFDEHQNLSDFELINKLLSNLYEWWSIPNIYNGLISIPKKQIENGNIDLIEKGYKFSRRIGLDTYQKESKITQLKKRIDEFFSSPLQISQLESEELGAYNIDYSKFKEDIINYLKGINIEEIKGNLFSVSFNLINKLLKIPKGRRKKKKEKPTKVTGDPFEAISLPILLEVEDLEEDAKGELSQIKIRIDKITLARTKEGSEDENKDKHSALVTKWYNFIYFLQNIEELITRQGIVNENGEEIKLNIVFQDRNGVDKYPFVIENTKNLVDAGILTSAKESESKSKFSLIYELVIGEKVEEGKYEWIISEQDSWIHVFNIFNDNKFNSLIKELYEFLPIGFSKKIDLLINSKNEEEFYYFLNSVRCEYINALDEIDKNGDIYIPATKLAKSFTNFIMVVREQGLFGATFKDLAVANLLNSYQEFIIYCTKLLKKNKRENKDINILSKCFLLNNQKEFRGKTIKGAIIPLYHPVMLEKVVERYRYLSNAFKELFDEIMIGGDIPEVRIKKAFDRFNQLSTIVFSTSILLSENNIFVTSRNNFGFFNIYGYVDEQNALLGNVANYGEIDYEEDEKISLASSPISNYISYTIKEYLNTYPSKVDGFTISFIKPNNYSDIISGLNDILKRLKKELEYRIKINLIIYTDDFRAIGSKYFSNWIESNFTEDDNITLESSIKLLKYDDYNISTLDSYFDRNVEKSDIVFFNDIMKVKEVIPEFVKTVKIENTENRFPTVYLPVKSYEEMYRKLNITQTQFSCEYLQAQFMVYLREPNSSEADYRIIKKVGINDSDYILLDKLHEKSNWVIVLDENIDIQILNNQKNKIIGFSTGEGYFGELNSTISSRDSIINDLNLLMRKRLYSKFSSWTQEQISYGANSCLEMTKYLDGSQILKALNPDDEAVNNYLAYLMTYQLEQIDSVNKDKFIIRKIINLDAYSHLFEDLTDIKVLDAHNYRPDLLVLELFKNDHEEKYKIYVKLIECKLANYNYDHIEKARLQVQSGYEHLSNVWNPENNTVQRRFWLNQLYRILSYNNEDGISYTLGDDSSFDLSEICEGNFNIAFSKDLYLYWLDKVDDKIIQVISGDDKSINEKHISHKVIRELLLKGYHVDEDQIEDEKPDEEEIAGNNDDKTDNKVIVDGGDNYLDDNDRNNYDSPGDDRGEVINVAENSNIILLNIVNLFREYENEKFEDEINDIKQKFETLKLILQAKKVKIIPKDSIIGPDIVRYCFDLDFMNNVKDITKNQDNIQLKLKLNEPPYIFIEDGLIKMDTARGKRQTVGLKTMYDKINQYADKLKDYKEHFYVLIGSDVLGQPYLLDLSDSNSPHLLIAGQTGSGKSVLLSSILVSIMSIYTPEEVEMVLVDPKRVELTAFKNSPFTKLVATEVDKAIELLIDLLATMEERYKIFELEGVKNINEYNSKNPDKKMKRVLMVFDEYASMMQADKEYVKIIESTIVRLSQEARAAGVHLIVCTQSPKAEIITTTIRNNLNARIGLKVADAIASKVVLDEGGAETLLGKGDMLVKTADSPKLTRIKSPYVTNEELEKLMYYLNNK
ncbi:hypothetical protein CPJCM30710_15060 [Clostridium polyendosporum]|uniref:FtsK domain-containing protein n=1 Tax=Clostridium polyendosporum TaxID=69208 RepID=A0A919S0D9_9CLOT|nr:FtsK/SpoIIIE domain-containing protein [Clostridium polyendosporum]GIM28840.1 hypothetical protein CPJCM30710_15060 [Clostridium polyendosporum]